MRLTWVSGLYSVQLLHEAGVVDHLLELLQVLAVEPVPARTRADYQLAVRAFREDELLDEEPLRDLIC